MYEETYHSMWLSGGGDQSPAFGQACCRRASVLQDISHTPVLYAPMIVILTTVALLLTTAWSCVQPCTSAPVPLLPAQTRERERLCAVLSLHHVKDLYSFAEGWACTIVCT